MTRDNFDTMATLWLRLADRYGQAAPPQMLSSGQREALQEVIGELGSRTPQLLTWACQNWALIRRRVGTDLGEGTFPPDPRLSCIAEHLTAIAQMAGEASTFGGVATSRFARSVPEADLPNGGAQVDRGVPVPV